MSRRFHLAFSVSSLLALIACVLLPLCQAQVYQVAVLQTLHGKATPKNPNIAYGINDSGQVAGVSSGEVVEWTPGRGITDIAENGCLGCTPLGGINSLGDVAGIAHQGPFLWTSAGGLQFLEQSAQPSGVNTSDQVAGLFFADQQFHIHAFLWTPQNPVLQDLGTLPGDLDSFPYGINDSGQVVGLSENINGRSTPFIWSGNTGIQAIPAPFVFPFAINNQGQVAGLASNAAIWTESGGTQELGVLPGTGGSWAVAISNAGTVVGNSWSSRPGFVFFWSPNQGMVNVNTLCKNKKQDWNAIGVNSSGQIVVNRKGGSVLLLTPVMSVGISSSPNPSHVGQTVTFTATVSSIAGPPPNGEAITFMDSKTILGTATLADGVATLSTSDLSAGRHSISASYAGDVNYAASSSTKLKQIVN